MKTLKCKTSHLEVGIAEETKGNSKRQNWREKEQVQLCGPPSIFEVNTDLTNAEHKPVSV